MKPSKTQEDVEKILLDEYRGQYVYFPNFCTKHQANTRVVQGAIDRFLLIGIISKVKAPRFMDEILMEYVVGENESFPEMEDPRDFMPLDIADYEVVHFYQMSR